MHALADLHSHCLAATFFEGAAAFALADGTVRVPARVAGRVQAHATPALVALRVDGGAAFLTTGEDGRVCVIDERCEVRELASVPRKWITAADRSGDRVAYASGRSVWLRGPGGPRELSHERGVKNLAFSPRGRWIAVAQADRVTLHDSASSDGEHPPPVHLEWKDLHAQATFSPDERFLVVASQQCSLHGWRLADRKHFRMLGYEGKVADWSWSSDGAWLATSGANAAIVWPFDGSDGPMHRQAWEVGARAEATVTSVAWAPHAERLAIGYSDGMVQVALLDLSVRPAVVHEPIGAMVTCLAWDDAGRRLAFGTSIGACGAVEVSA